MARTETLTVVITDHVASTALASHLGHDVHEALRHERCTALCTAVAEHTGTELKTTGDGLMLSFASAVRLWRDQGKRIEAPDLLAYSRFTEGVDTRDLHDAKALLMELGE